MGGGAELSPRHLHPEVFQQRHYLSLTSVSSTIHNTGLLSVLVRVLPRAEFLHSGTSGGKARTTMKGTQW